MEEKHGFFNYAIDLVSVLNSRLNKVEDRYMQEKENNPTQAENYHRDIITLQNIRDLAIRTIANPLMEDERKYSRLSRIMNRFSSKIYDGGLKENLTGISRDATEKAKSANNLENKI